MGITTDIKSRLALIKLVNWISKYSLSYYIAVTIILIISQLDIFKENVPIEFVVNLVIAISTFTIATNVLDKILKKHRQDPKPFLYCPECPDAKMRTSGRWVCENCHKEFGEPRKEG